ncbi:MAG: acyl-CoA dehydrogenase, partial [Rubrivivax sp.]
GGGGGRVEEVVVKEELGSGIVNAPFAAAALMTQALLAEAPEAVQADWLPAIASGEALVVPALYERASRHRWQRVGVRATPAAQAEDGWVLDGAKCVVPAGDEADAFIVTARHAGADDAEAGLGLFLVRRADARVVGYPTQDGARAADLHLAATPAVLLQAEGHATLARAVDVGSAAVCAEGVGLMDRLVAITVDYMNTRRQFGTTLASFQALRHRIADVKMQLELGRSMSYYATLKLGEPPAQRQRAVAQARVQLGHSLRFVGQQCIQLHGGIGCTDEYVASHCFKRLTMLEMTLGDTLHHLGEVSARMQDTAGVFA